MNKKASHHDHHMEEMGRERCISSPTADLPKRTLVAQFHIFLAGYQTPAILFTMRSTKYIIWEEDGQWHGYLQDYPDRPTQGNTFEDLQIKLSDLHYEVTSGYHDQYHDSTYTIPQRTRPRTKRYEQVEQLFRTMLYDL